MVSNSDINIGRGVVVSGDESNLNALLLMYQSVYRKYSQVFKDENVLVSQEALKLSKETGRTSRRSVRRVKAIMKTLRDSDGIVMANQQNILALEDAIALQISDGSVLNSYIKKSNGIGGSLYSKLRIKKVYLHEKPKLVQRVQNDFYNANLSSFDDVLKKYECLMSDLKDFKRETGYTPELFDSVFNDVLYGVESLLLGFAGQNRVTVDYEIRNLLYVADKYERKNLRRRAVKKLTDVKQIK